MIAVAQSSGQGPSQGVVTVNHNIRFPSRYNQIQVNFKGALKEEGHEGEPGEGYPICFIFLLQGDLWIDCAHLSLQYFPGSVGHHSEDTQSQDNCPVPIRPQT